MFERGCIESQVSERGHFRSGFLLQRAKKTTDSAARRAFPVCLRAKRLGTNSNALAFARVEGEVQEKKSRRFLGGGFFGGEMQMQTPIQMRGVLAPPAHARTRLFFALRSSR